MTNKEFREKYGEEAYQRKKASNRKWNLAHKDYFKNYYKTSGYAAWKKKYREEHERVDNLPGVRKNVDEYKKEHPVCEICGCDHSIECHHLNKLTTFNYKEGRNKYNLITVCSKCHHAIHFNLLEGKDADMVNKRMYEALLKMIADAFPGEESEKSV